MNSALAGIGMTSLRTRMRMIDKLRRQGVRNEAVLEAMATVPRHIFVDEALNSRAYEDMALPLGFGQTISQPYVVARMIEALLGARPGLGKTLEIGTGCGYQTAVLGKLTRDVYSVERIAPLLARAEQHLKRIPGVSARLRHADGSIGFPEAAPFDSIIVAAAARQVPPALLQQLAVEGCLILPLGDKEQYLCHIQRTLQGFAETRLEKVRFVPLLSGIES
ncbi:MAG: protein-L-isoaspartate(D-aspartate) O-methyltransferase [Zoogloeaceae bacterium]|nr:protein-L-isoaspartate(D-aspartate) O-methyltransferase [Zoogloeaceae bacterium]